MVTVDEALARFSAAFGAGDVDAIMALMTDDVVFENRGHEWRLERRGDEFWVEMPDPLWFNEPAWFMQTLQEDWPDSPPRFEARVVMTTGSHLATIARRPWSVRRARVAGALWKEVVVR